MSRRRGAVADAAPGRTPSPERGMVTVELAVGFVTASFLALTLAGGVSLGVHQAACAGASAGIARQLARGDHLAAEAALREAPPGAEQRVRHRDDGVEVQVSAPVALLGLGQVEVSARSWSRWEAAARP